MQFFGMRGTTRGLRTAVALATSEYVDERLFGDEGDSAYGPFGVRIVEGFRSREYPLVTLESAAATPGLVPVTEASRWRASDGLSALLRRYEQFASQYSNELPDVDSSALPTQAPADGTAEVWRAFLRLELGMPDLAERIDPEGYRRYLQRRYRSIEDLRSAHALDVARFADVAYPATAPQEPRRLEDWQRYEAIVRPMWRTASRFTVMVPVPAGGAARDADVQRKRQIADRVVRLEKPAHTVYDVQLYWALFRVGHARLGHDSLIHLGGRAPELLAPAVLGRAYVAQSHVGWSPKHDAIDRTIIGHDVLGSSQSSPRENLS
jgi:hypothetical protein